MKYPSWPPIKGYRNIEFGLKRVFALLARIGNPHLKLPPVIHVAGTNGKGSTLAFLQAIFEENNYSVHKYISPHLVNFNERIILNGKEIGDNFLNECLKICQKASEKEPKIEITYFEGITVAAFLAFSLKKADILLLETGMGGELDATNVLPQVLCSIITPISFDHQDFLGNSIEEIAKAKAGIIKKNCPIVTIQHDKISLEIIKEAAQNLNSSLNIIQNNQNNNKIADFLIKSDENSRLWQIIAKDKIYNLPRPNLIGDFQLENATLAIAALLTQRRFHIKEESFTSAITKAKWRGRLQKICNGKFYKILPKNCDLYLDGSHNIAGAEILNHFLSKQKGKKIYAIVAMLRDKDYQNFIKIISPKIDYLIASEIENEKNSLSWEEIYKIAKNQGIFNVDKSANIEDAFKIIEKHNIEPGSLIIICGSLYFAGEFLQKND